MSSYSSEHLSPKQLREQLADFWLQIEELATIIGIDTQALVADHIAMRINDWQLTEQVHQAWLMQGKQISNAQINGRPIIVIKLDDPLKVQNQNIDCLELPYPSDKTYPQEGWEHVEFIVESKAQTTQDLVLDIKKAFPKVASLWDKLAELGVKVKMSSPKGEGERLANPTVAFKHKGVCIKLHPHSLEAIVASEQS